jgi:hypothetical protein
MIDNNPFLPRAFNSKKKRARKVKIEFTDQRGAKYCFTAEGPSKENMVKMIDFVETMTSQNDRNHDEEQTPIDTNFARVYNLIESRFKFGSFTSSDVLEAYEDEFQLPSSLSTISTYLARLADRELLTRSRNGAGWIYRLVRIEQEAPPEVAVPNVEERSSPTNFIPR